MSFEFVKMTGNSIDCVEMDSETIDFARNIANKANYNEVTFIEDSLPKLKKMRRDCYNQIFLIDVLEHVYKDTDSLITINLLLKLHGILIISVPTTNYPKYFGYEFADTIGHVRDGYSIEELETLLTSSGFEIIEWSYHTNYLSSYICEFWYKYSSIKLKIVLFPLLKFLICFDFLVRGTNSCGIALKAKKVRTI